jgi:hypothetical protein
MTRFQHEIIRRLLAAGFTPGHPAITAIRAWNAAARRAQEERTP